MRITFDPAKSARNVALRRPTFESAEDFEFETALTWVDDRQDYGETRWISLGYLYERLHVLCYLVNSPDEIRVISFRKANARERRLYEQAQTLD